MANPNPSGFAALLNGISLLVLSFASFYCICNEGIVRKRPHGLLYVTSVVILLATNCAELIIVCLRDLSRGDKENTVVPLTALICFCLLSLTRGGTQHRLTWTVVVMHHLLQPAAQGTSFKVWRR
ncbi:uncharacterized protein BKA55DRAFT_261989 [Fusarium redolens]|uniref:Uncharacterized protein n=1 Tax=Fusarium redolens TaxID=48865 RepID=A0A9P9FX66_FUSRE|nr:uncharacterized protein BKA55DRAFT_261989 [Fusarium redolens]KAH7208426.1 hypothetical protein BKA55DRAFT_261989 [Fusarium redolens]